MSLQTSIQKSYQTLKVSLPIMLGVLLLISLMNIFWHEYYTKIFTNNPLIDTFIGSIAGSLSFGIPITSYVIGGELLGEGVNLLAITAFMLSWSTVGIAMLPLEARFLGRKFAVIRNSTNFIFSILISFLVIYTINIF